MDEQGGTGGTRRRPEGWFIEDSTEGKSFVEKRSTESLVPLPQGTSAKEALRMVYCGEIVLSPQQMRAAIESLPYENPKLSATAHVNFNYADQLDKAIAKAVERSQRPTPMLCGPAEQLPAEVANKPFSSFRRF